MKSNTSLDINSEKKNTSVGTADREIDQLLQKKESYQSTVSRGILWRDLVLLLLLIPFAVIIWYSVNTNSGDLDNTWYIPVTRYLEIDPTRLVFFGTIFTTIFVLAELVCSLPFWHFYLKSKRDIRQIRLLENEIEDSYLLSPSKRLIYFQKQSIVIAGKAGKISWIDDKRRKRSDELRREIGNVLAALEKIQNSKKINLKKDEKIHSWDDAQFGLGQWQELIGDEEREAKGERNWKLISLAIALSYFLILILWAKPRFVFAQATGNAIGVFGIPFQIIAWSALGSFASILYRFYKSPRRINFEIELRWIIARPLIGIVMGALVYIALVSGFLVFNINPSGDAATIDVRTAAQLPQYWIVAFLAGFSDKFYEKVVESLVGKFGAGKENESETYVEKTESKIEITTEKDE